MLCDKDELEVHASEPAWCALQIFPMQKIQVLLCTDSNCTFAALLHSIAASSVAK